MQGLAARRPLGWRRRPIRPAVLALVLISALAGCTVGGAEVDAGDHDRRDPTSGGATPPGEPPPPPAEASVLPGRLLVKRADGSLISVRPDATELQVLARAVQGEVDVLQGAWSADGSRVAWSQVVNRDGRLESEVVTAGPLGQDEVRTPTSTTPFYLSWDPTSSRVGFLGSDGGDRFELAVVEAVADDADRLRSLGRGSPFYFSWAPDGQRLLAHVGGGRLDELDLGGVVEPIEDLPGAFQAPAWSPDGAAQVYAVARGSGERQQVMTRDVASGSSTAIADADGTVSLVLAPDGRHVAFQSLNADERDLYDRTLPQRATDVGVTVVDLVTGEVERITIRPAMAFSWSPDGRRLLILEPMYTPGRISFRWIVWERDAPGGDAERFATASFTPGLSLLRDYTPFFSQYAQSSTMWAPDGSAFAYPALGSSADTEIVVQPLDPDIPSYVLGAGSSVAWAPDAAVSAAA